MAIIASGLIALWPASGEQESGDPPSTTTQAPADPVVYDTDVYSALGFKLKKASWDLSVEPEGKTRARAAPRPLEMAEARKWENLSVGVSSRRRR